MNDTPEIQDQDDAQVAELASLSTGVDCSVSDVTTNNAVPAAEPFIGQAEAKVLEVGVGGIPTDAAPSEANTTSPAPPAQDNAEQVVRYALVQPAVYNTSAAPVAALQGNPYDTSAATSPAHAQALLMASLGHTVFPLYGIKNGLCTCGNATCPNAGKHPRHTNPFKEATTNPAVINMWFKYEPDLNYGVRLGQPMGNTSKMAMVVDVDRYKVGGAEALEELEKTYGRLPETVEVLTGAGGSHYYFFADSSLSFTDKLGKNVDLKVNGYVVGPGSVHASGRRYEMEASSDLFEGHVMADLPQWVSDNFSKFAKQTESDVEIAPNTEPLSPYERASIEYDLAAISAACSRDEWLKVLMGLHCRNQSKEMFDIADEWSQTCPEKYDAGALIKAWNSLKPRDGITYGTVRMMAMEERIKDVDISKLLESLNRMSVAEPEYGTAGNPIAVPDKVFMPAKLVCDIPSHLLTIPGKLGQMVDWTNATAMKPQPMFAVQAALALGSVAMGRKFRTTNDNWPSLFFLNIGVSGAGKEHAKTAIERVLRAAKFSTLSPASEYTSDSAIDSMLRTHPTHIAIIDEFGYMLKTANAKNNTNGGTARKRLMEVFGRCGGTLQPKAFSTATLTQAQRDGLGPRHVENPALTVLGMTTPTPFYEAVGSGALTDGFLNRLIVVESDLGRQPARFVDQIAMPDDLVRWVRECRVKGSGDLADVIDTAHSEVAVPAILDFSGEARRLFTKLELRCIERMDELEMHGIAEMYSRVREIAMRVSLIVAHSSEADMIGAEHAQWAIDYVTFWADRAISRMADNIADSPFAALCNDVANLILKAGRRGLTVFELARKSTKFKGADTRMRRSVFENLASDRNIRCYETKSASGKGKTRAAYIVSDFIQERAQE
ncbi:bifunctional DNA primase/polymerase [Telluria mixta]|uniref:Bifunctional DNA primase/polymerase n=1 Tax=Telluria mixta TaxID=34071 RepID=A0ABT2C2P4_9BURK|nr:bifunctional DNA primase/polymerase [Telluria mixta]MCS0631663.1 bifunctional DNA primase/polymerase [Telluria mixta]WEM98413.1 bifunctional DNA primase/polymerase [Telluria mixta]